MTLKDPKKTAEALAQKHGKPPVFEGLLLYFPRAVKEVARVSAYGKEKHGFEYRDRGFLRPEYTEDMYRNAAIRHILDHELEGPINVEDGECFHMAQAAWDILAALEKHLEKASTEKYEDAVKQVINVK